MRAVPSRGTRIALAIVVGALCAAAPASSESAFALAWPATIGRVPATTYDDHGAPLGAANLLMESLASGGIRVFSQSGEDGGAHNVAMADLAPIDAGKSLRLVKQESRAFDVNGKPLGLLSVDHQARRARCMAPDGSVRTEIELAAEDRVVNVPLNLFFLPLVTGAASKLQFQLFLCKDRRAQLLDFQAWAVQHGENGLVEIRYAPDLGLLSPFAKRLVPRLSFWFDPRAPHGWAAHRLPIYTGGPEVLVVRQGIPLATLAN
jgi:hypothetical protein